MICASKKDTDYTILEKEVEKKVLEKVFYGNF